MFNNRFGLDYNALWMNAFDKNEGLKNLDSLILAHNQLSKVPANVFSHLVLLNSLELEGNQITYVDKDAFAGLEGKLFTHTYTYANNLVNFTSVGNFGSVKGS